MTSRRSSKNTPRLLSFIGLILWLYPAEFRLRFREEFLQTINDELDYGILAHLSAHRAKAYSYLFFDLLVSIVQERYTHWRQNMQSKTNLLYALGITLMCYWVAILGWAMLKVLAGLAIPAPEEVLLGKAPSALAWSIYEGTMIYGPIAAMVLLLTPLVRLEWNGPDGNLIISVALPRSNLWHKLLLVGSIGISIFIVVIALLRAFGFII